VVPVFGWASWPVKEIVAPGLSSKQTRLRELVGRKRAVRSSVFHSGAAPDDSQARELYPTLPQQLRACEGGRRGSLVSAHDGSPKGGKPGLVTRLVDRQIRVVPSHLLDAEEENHHAGSG
jgi:hypothetical protein